MNLKNVNANLNETFVNKNPAAPPWETISDLMASTSAFLAWKVGKLEGTLQKLIKYEDDECIDLYTNILHISKTCNLHI